MSKHISLAAALTLIVVVGMSATAQSQVPVIDEDFGTVTETGGGVFLGGSGSATIGNWDDGITGESARGGTVGNAKVKAMSAMGTATGGVDGTGGGVIDVSGVNFDLVSEDFDEVTGSGGGVFLAPGGPDTFNYTPSWDGGTQGEAAFAGTFGGAVVAGGISALGIPGAGVSGGSGQLDVDNVDITTGGWFAGVQFEIGSLPGASPFLNPSFDDNGGSLDGWGPFGNTYLSDGEVPARSGGHVLKMFGQFSGSFNVGGAVQRLSAAEGQTWELDAFSRQKTGDDLTTGSNYVVMKVEFKDESDSTLAEIESTILGASSGLDTWIDNEPIQLTAPAGTVEALAVILFIQPAGLFEGGAGFVDDVSFKRVSGPSNFDLSQFALTIDIQGTADGAAGEVLGDYQMRMEDENGDRLIFSGTADGNWQTLGGPLSDALDADSSGTGVPGAFNPHSASFVVVVAFDNGGATPWGTGGTLTVDNLSLSNPDPTGSDWFAEVRFDNLPAFSGDPTDIVLTADILGSITDGEYELKVQGFVFQEVFDIEENFANASGSEIILTGSGFNAIQNWAEEIDGEEAFAGTFGNTTIGSVVARADTDGLGDTGSGELRVEDVVITDGGWFAGLTWPNRSLGTIDRGSVFLQATIKGTATSGGTPGGYELRIEDAQQDSLYFTATADGGFQGIGGSLATATERAALSGGGDGTFDLDSPSFTVVVAFGDSGTWGAGGVLTVDELVLVAESRREIGSASFARAASGEFQSVGGPLANGDSSFGDFAANFESVTGTGSASPQPGGGDIDNWDDGVDRENAFFGTWGDAVINGGAVAQGCLACGADGTAAAQIVVTDVPPNTGGWFAGMYWRPLRTDLSGDLDDVILTAEVKGTPATGDGEAGGPLGTYFLRIEDADKTALTFELVADGSFQTIGGDLSLSFLSDADPGTSDGVFDLNAGIYTVTVGFIGLAGNWGSGGTLTVDNLFLSGTPFDAADTYRVSVAFRDPLATWGTDATLTVDNLLLGPSSSLPGFRRGDCNNDSGIDISDASCLLNWLFLGGEAPACLAGSNANGDSAADISDASYLLNYLFLGGPAPPEPFAVCGPGTLEADEQLGCDLAPANCQ